jgi:hypothetical protein
VVQDKASEDVERLPCVRVSAGIVRKEAERIVVELCGDFAKEHKRPSDLKVSIRFPFTPDALESLPHILSHRAVEQTVLGGLLDARAANLAVGGDTHDLQPGSDREALVEGEPNEGAHFLWAGVVPNSGNGLLRGSVPKAETLDDGYHVRWSCEVSGVNVSSFGGVAKEGGVP